MLEAIRQGDKAAWDFVALKLYNPLLNFVFGMVREREPAEELVQDVFVNFWVKRDSIQITASLKSYLYRAARNHALNFIKRRKFEQEYHRGLAQSAIISKNDTEDTFQFSELEKKLAEAIEGLPDSCREIFKLSRFEELTYKEISETLDVPVRTVHYQIGLALKDLRSKLKGFVTKENLLMAVSMLLAFGFMK